jgi:hypothetical protein
MVGLGILMTLLVGLVEVFIAVTMERLKKLVIIFVEGVVSAVFVLRILTYCCDFLGSYCYKVLLFIMLAITVLFVYN